MKKGSGSGGDAGSSVLDVLGWGRLRAMTLAVARPGGAVGSWIGLGLCTSDWDVLKRWSTPITTQWCSVAESPAVMALLTLGRAPSSAYTPSPMRPRRRSASFG